MFATCSATIRARCAGEVTDGEEREEREEREEEEKSFSGDVERCEFKRRKADQGSERQALVASRSPAVLGRSGS